MEQISSSPWPSIASSRELYLEISRSIRGDGRSPSCWPRPWSRSLALSEIFGQDLNLHHHSMATDPRTSSAVNDRALETGLGDDCRGARSVGVAQPSTGSGQPTRSLRRPSFARLKLATFFVFRRQTFQKRGRRYANASLAFVNFSRKWQATTGGASDGASRNGPTRLNTLYFFIYIDVGLLYND